LSRLSAGTAFRRLQPQTGDFQSQSNNHRLSAGGCLDQGIGFLENLLPTSTYPFAKNRPVVRIASDDPVARLKELAPSELQAKLTIFQSQTASRSSPASVGDVAHGWCSQ
jgi:hypothetical protein